LNHSNCEELITEISSKYFPGLEIVLLEGEYSNLEIRIAGSDKRVHDFPKILYRILKKTKLWKTEFLKVKNTLKNRKVKIKIKNINKCNSKAKNFYWKLVDEYSIFGKVNLPDIAVYGFWESIPQNDIYIFVPKAGIKYALGFIEERGQTKNIMLWECHLSLDMTKELKIFAKELKNKKVAIIDRSYSSNSLDYLEKKVMREGGQPLKIALFPKSKRAIQHSDYILFLDKLIPSKNIQFKKKWAEDLFIKIVNDEDF
jgi:phage anti-repressor protein